MAIVELTTTARVKAALGIDVADTTQDVWLAGALQAVSQRFELFMDRPIELTSRTEEYDVHDGRQVSLFLRAYPVTAITSVKNATGWDFASATAIDSTSYRIDADNGQLHMAIELAYGPKAVQVIYTGGLAANTADLITNYPSIAMAADFQIAAMFRRRSTPQGTGMSGKQGGSITFEGPLKLIPEAREILASFTRMRFGV